MWRKCALQKLAWPVMFFCSQKVLQLKNKIVIRKQYEQWLQKQREWRGISPDIQLGHNMDSERRERKRVPQSQSERDSYNGSQQADDNLALTFRRHLQSRSNLNHNNQFLSRPENIKHVWCLQPSTGSWTVLWCVEDYRGCRYSPALTAKTGWLPSIVVLIGIPHHRRSYKIRSPNVSRYVKWLKILQEFWKVVERQLKSTRSCQNHIVGVTVWFDVLRT